LDAAVLPIRVAMPTSTFLVVTHQDGRRLQLRGGGLLLDEA
jgi:hypothetical protein